MLTDAILALKPLFGNMENECPLWCTVISDKPKTFQVMGLNAVSDIAKNKSSAFIHKILIMFCAFEIHIVEPLTV